MKLTIEMNLDNAAFQECREIEIKRILENAIKRIGFSQFGYSKYFDMDLFDLNGNNVGTFKIKE
jgi:hypothetical protein